VNSTETTPAPAPAGDRQIGQLLGGRYRLAMSKGGDDVADVWHALDESTQTVVTLEILRDRGNESARQRFLAEARRMAAIERPSVMRVASILDEGTETFIVFEHLIPLPVVLTGLTAVARDVRPATKAAEDNDKTVVLTAVAGPRPTVAQDGTAGQDVLADESASAVVELDGVREPSVPHLVAATTRLPETVRDATRSLMSARTDMSRVVPWATRLLADARRFVRDVMRDAQIDTLIADARAWLASVLSRPHMPSAGTAKPVSDAAAITGPSLSNLTALGARVLSSAGPLVTRARANPVVSAGAIGVLVLAAFIVSPLDDAIGSALRGGPAPSPTVVPRAALVPAGFVLPPLSAYGATFESQGPYPTTTPNGTVEWVVALRNTGSAGWYRGIEGAQAALTTPDGAGVAVQSTDYVAPGQVGWFVVRFKARAELGTYTVQLLPRIDGRGLLPELGIYTVVTVAKNP
jgi:hypothetical protein